MTVTGVEEGVPATPLVSVCILSWNTLDLVRRNLQTLYATPAPFPLEVIVVDNASTDGSADMVAAEFPQVRLLRHTENLLFARGMNAGARIARGRYLLFLNSDCFITPDTLGCMVEFMEQHPRARLAGARQRRGDGRIETSLKLCPGLERTVRRLFFLSAGWSRRKLCEGNRGRPVPAPMLPGSCLLARCELLDHPGLFDEGFTLGVEDSDLSYRVRRAGYEVWYLPQCEVIHLHAQSRGQLSRAERDGPMVDGAILFCRKHYSLPYRRTLALVEGLLLLRDTLGILVLNVLTLGRSRKHREAFQTMNMRRRLIAGLWRR